MPDCRMIDCNVPILNSAWSGTGTVIVPSVSIFLHNDMAAAPANFGKAVLRQDLTDLFS